MKIKIINDKTKKEKIVSIFKANEIQFVDENEDYVLVESKSYTQSLIGKIGSEYFILKPEEIIYVEADGNDCICVTLENKYFIKEKIYQIEGILYENKFLRVSRSHVININMIKSISPTQNMKFKLTLRDNSHVYVTRSYYYIFKDYLGL